MKEKTTWRSKIVGLLACFLGLSLVFVGGIFSQNTQLEKISEYATDVVVNHTTNKKLCALMVGNTDESGPIADASSDFNNLYGTFKQQKITFASMINVDRQHDIKLPYDNSPNLSMLYSGAIATIEYHGHYKHHMLPIETMFQDTNNYDISRYLAYISQSQADAILDDKGISRCSDGSFLISDYQSLLRQIIPITIDGMASNFVIQNIYYESNYYYEGIYEVSGDFIMVSYYLPNNLRQDQTNLYFMSDYSYQNKYFMNYINEVYSSKKYSIRVSHYNILDEIDDDYLLSFYYTSKLENLEWITTFLLLISGLMMIYSLFVAFSNLKSRPQKPGLLYIVSSLVVMLAPYLLFSLIYQISGNVAIMSETSSKTNLLYISIYAFCLLIIRIVTKKQIFSKKHNKGDAYYDVNI